MVKPGTHAQPLRLDVDASDVKITFKKFSTLLPQNIRVGLIESMDIVGLVAVSKYMKVRTLIDYATGKIESRKSAAEKLGVVTSRLARSIQNKESKHGLESIRRILVVGKDLVAEMGSSVPYAAIHEYGGQAGRGGSTTIPARPYLNPALKASDTMIFHNLKLKLELTIKAAESAI